ncbi:MAG: UDP-N-acetylmuramoyl-L-alanyl-D-glutamate--2,6-diaminopimelate ligase [Zoogloeaceae bacterium]|nr:UDP-N-acetylmuramoyl-L-alanyl-D-glutamate--2,6-diaminopimelate ligase [Rhodocyclaceae bacterium]MCP5235233.1 UDP-N-acetylmuramoyl-L-alanyl-D-glutamate--2,6-diaminopimelate ligase [Zoogloeaceae bacterium]
MTTERARDLLARLESAGVRPRGISADSRAVSPGDLFVAYPGFSNDGRRFIGDAVARGAAAVLWEADGGEWPGERDLPNLPVPQLRDQVGDLADQIFNEPSRRLWVAGVTGTNGKTTVSQWIGRATQELGGRCAIIGTLGCGFPGALEPGLHTTPDAVDVHRQLDRFARAGADCAAMEVSSIGLDQGRVNGVRFDLAIHTNLTRDHLDYHGDMASYARAKARLFDTEGISAAVINADDAFGRQQAQILIARGVRVIAYGLDGGRTADLPGAEFVLADDMKHTIAGQQFQLCWQGRRLPMSPQSIGTFNVSNMLAVIACLLVRGVVLDEAARVVGHLRAPEGRMQLLGGVAEPLVVVDYAHTPDALTQVLEATRATAQTREGRLICVFGCGGDRDAGKRPLMGEVASRLADDVILTSDNPRGEDPESILAEIAVAAPDAECIVDRSAAIRHALLAAAADDVVVLAGKGHENYQEIKGVRRPYSDIAQARDALTAWRAAGRRA